MAEPTLPESKRCPRCGETKTADLFHVRTVDGRQYLSSKCHPCTNAYAVEKRRTDPRFHKLHLEAGRRSREKYADDPDRQLAKREANKRDYVKNGKRRRAAYFLKPEVRKKDQEYCRRYREKNKGRPRTDEQIAKARAASRRGNLRRQQDPEWVTQDKIRNKAWVLTNKDRVRIYKSAYLSRRRAGGGDLATIRRNFLECLDSYRIGNQYWDAYESCLIDEPSIDHIVPLKAGGTNDTDNLCVTSRTNNSGKRESSLLMYLWKRAVAFDLRKVRL